MCASRNRKKEKKKVHTQFLKTAGTVSKSKSEKTLQVKDILYSTTQLRKRNSNGNTTVWRRQHRDGSILYDSTTYYCFWRSLCFRRVCHQAIDFVFSFSFFIFKTSRFSSLLSSFLAAAAAAAAADVLFRLVRRHLLTSHD